MTRSPIVDYAEAKRLATEIFPQIPEKGATCAHLRLRSLEEGYSEPTFRRKYYQWRKATSEDPEDDGVYAIIDRRKARKYLVSETQFFKEVLATYKKRKFFAVAYREVHERYTAMGMMLPQGSSLVNLRRYLQRVQEFSTQEVDTPKCVDCRRKIATIISLLDDLILFQMECRNCNRRL